MVVTPTNPNLLNDKGARMVLKRAPNLVYFVQKVRIPSLRIGVATQWAPMDQMPWPGDTLYRDDFSVSFKINEDMTNYLEMWDWMVRSVAPDRPEQYRSLVGSAKTQRASDLFSDVTVMVPGSSYRPNIEFRLEDAFPMGLESLDFTTDGQEVGFLDSTVTFRYRHFTMHRMGPGELEAWNIPPSIVDPENP